MCFLSYVVGSMSIFTNTSLHGNKTRISIKAIIYITLVCVFILFCAIIQLKLKIVSISLVCWLYHLLFGSAMASRPFLASWTGLLRMSSNTDLDRFRPHGYSHVGIDVCPTDSWRGVCYIHLCKPWDH